MKKTVSFLIIILTASALCFGQQPLTLTLENAIAIARSQSVDAAVALNELRTSYWEYRTYRADLLPEINFNATLPAYAKQYSTYMDDNGNYSFVRTNTIRMNGELSVDQKIWPTGGTLSLSSQIDFLRQLDGDKSNRFMSIPVALTLTQPIFGTNTVKWNRKIEPVRYAEAKAKFLSATEDVAMTAIKYYFTLLMSQEKLEIARQNLDNATKLHEVAKVKREMGQISKNDLLQMELNLLNAEAEFTEIQSTLKSDMFTLRSFLGIDENRDISTEIPEGIPDIDISYSDAIGKALANNKFAHNIMRRQLEADYEVAKAKGNLRQIDLFARIGFTGTGRDLSNAYNPLKSNEIVEIGFKIPIVDWGKRAGKVQVAKSNREVARTQIQREKINFSQNLFILVERFNNQRRQLGIARKASDIAATRYNTNVETFLIGKISTLDLNDSQVKKDESRQQFVNQLYLYWEYYYRLRSLTLWDYSLNTGIDADIDKIIKSNDTFFSKNN